MSMPSWKMIAIYSVVAVALVWAAGHRAPHDVATGGRIVIDNAGPRSAWAKALGDIDSDGRADVLVGGHERKALSIFDRVLRKLGLRDSRLIAGELVWYQNPTWQKNLISNRFHVRTDLEVADIDADGLNDVVVLADEGVFWLQNPHWSAHEVQVETESRLYHDVEVSDLDRDGDLDIVLRNQSLFDHNNGDRVHLIMHEEKQTWRTETIHVPHGEGLKVGDIDGDGYDDIVVNDVWLKNPGAETEADGWREEDYTAEWTWSNVYIDISDVNSDGVADIILSPSEPIGAKYRISWFAKSSAGAWVEHVVDSRVEAIHHFVGGGDYDGDGDVDIFSAEMNQGDDPDEVSVYLNEGDGGSWRKRILGIGGSHSMKVGDLDGDDRADLIGANWQIADYDGDYPVTLWKYDGVESSGWRRHVIGSNAPWRNLFVHVADIDSDGDPDVLAGRSWFKNPGTAGAEWLRIDIGGGIGTALYPSDFDGDGHIDIFGSRWDGMLEPPGLFLRLQAKLSGAGYPGTGGGGEFLWGRNDGHGNFQPHANIASVAGDYLQGIARHVDSESVGLLLSWHQPGNGIHRVNIPADVLNAEWTIDTVTSFSQDEQLSSVDIDGDGIGEVITGTSVLQASDGWAERSFFSTSSLPDRHAVADVDGDGTADVVVGYESSSAPGKLAWYQDIASTGQAREVVIDYPVGPMSLGAIDIDGDEDIDLIVGEHDLVNPDRARLLKYENVDGSGLKWRKTVLATGDEHHNGALAVDIDLDGDNDIISIGWQHSNVLVFENRETK